MNELSFIFQGVTHKMSQVKGKTEVRDQRSEVSKQRSEIRDKRAEVSAVRLPLMRQV